MCDIKIKDFLTDESKWTQGCNARDEGHMSVPIDDSSAKCFCLSGAALRCYGGTDAYLAVVSRIDSYLHREFSYRAGVVAWNDCSGRTFEDIRTVLETLDV